MARIDLRHISDENPNKFIKTAGNYVLKIKSVVEDGYTTDGDLQRRITFVSSEGENITERFAEDGKHAWRFRRLINNMHVPADFDSDDLVGRYVNAEIGMTKTGYASICEFYYSKLNDKLPKIEEKAQEQNDDEKEAEDLF
jgi:hypothetical protein